MLCGRWCLQKKKQLFPDISQPSSENSLSVCKWLPFFFFLYSISVQQQGAGRVWASRDGTPLRENILLWNSMRKRLLSKKCIRFAYDAAGRWSLAWGSVPATQTDSRSASLCRLFLDRWAHEDATVWLNKTKPDIPAIKQRPEFCHYFLCRVSKKKL